ncbi:mucin-2 [Cydia fagiglandana]|uniref:mucin-2 n=1 Tax=Cydia fagiglandana TaxID=1458189 RepID=UPI002FEE473D
MESSEDDAGAATNASRRASAREKDLGLNEEVDATANASREASGAQTPCESGTMSEDNFDGDSVPSPSTHDNNASTEAILDMIDEICDGPGAPKRVPLSTEFDEPATSPPTPTAPPAPSEPPPLEPPATEHLAHHSIPQLEENASTSQNTEDPQVGPVLSPVSSAKCESAPEILPETPVDNISESSVSADTNTSNIEPQASSSVPEVCGPAEPDAPEAQNLNVEAASTCSAVNIPSSSVETVPSVCEISECESNDRTVKHVTSSDNRDNVTVESVESTSSDVSVSEGTQESATRSPLRRRLIRPTPYDRRPDTTVSSTVDSQVSDNDVGQTSSDSVAKDVSSSSDIIPPVHGKVKDVESSNVSEISVCKAETSTTPSRKIKLVRQKVTPSTSQSEKSQSQAVTPEIEAPSTSSHTVPSTVTASCSSDCISTTEVTDEADKAEPSRACQSESVIAESIVDPINKLTNKTPVVSKENEQQSHSSGASTSQVSENEDVHKKVPPIKLNLAASNVPDPVINDTSKQIEKHLSPEPVQDSPETSKQIPKLTIKLSGKQPEDIKSPIPKLTIKPIKPPAEDELKTDNSKNSEPIPNITKINIKPILRPPEKINDIHRKSSSSEISESECSENDETSTSDQASTSDQGPTDIIPKVTIKLGKPGTDGEGKFYTDQTVPKLTIKGLQQPDQEASDSKLKLVVSPSEEKVDKIPKLTIKTVAKSDSQLSPKLTIKPIKPVENSGKDSTADQSDAKMSKSKSADCADTSGEIKETTHIPKITIKPVLKSDIESSPKKSVSKCDNLEQIPVVTKLNIKPILKPTDEEVSEEIKDEVPVVSKLNIKPILKPKDSEVDSSIEEIPKVTKLNIKPLKHPEGKSSEQKDCDEWNADSDQNSIPVVTKLNIKPIVKPLDKESMNDTENQSSETGNSSDDNTDIPVVTKLNIKPILKPSGDEDIAKPNTSESNIPVVTKLNIKPIIKPEENAQPSSPKKEIPVITKLNIKPVVKPDDLEQSKSRDTEDANVKNPPLVMKINMKAVTDASSEESFKADIKINNLDEKIEHVYNNINDSIPVVSKINIKPLVKPMEDEHVNNDLSNCHNEDSSIIQATENCLEVSKTEKFNSLHKKETIPVTAGDHKTTKENCLPNESKTLNRETSHSNDLDGNSSVAGSNKKEHVNTNVEPEHNEPSKTTPSVKQTTLSNCTLLKKLLEHKKKDVETRVKEPEESDPTVPEETKLAPAGSTSISNCGQIDKVNSKSPHDKKRSNAPSQDVQNQTTSLTPNAQSLNRCRAENESVTKPLEINISEKITTTSSGQDSPRIILKINKTDHGPSAKIITEDIKKPETVQDSCSPENTQEMVNDKQRKGIVNSKRKGLADASPTVALGKRLRSSRVVQESEKSPPIKRNAGKRPPSVEISPPQKKEPELSVLETKRLKLGQLLSNKALTVRPVNPKSQNATSDAKTGLDCKQTTKAVNHLNNENCSKNGNSKLHNILSNLQAKQIQVMPLNSMNCVDKTQPIEIDSSTSTGSSDVTEVIAIERSHPEVQEMIINENSESHDFNMANDELSQDPLEVDHHLKTNEVSGAVSVPFTPQPKKRGRPRKLPVSEGAKPVITLPTPALEERPQRSLRLTRDRPAILVKPRGRGRGRGVKRTLMASPPKEPEPIVETATNFFIKEEKTPEEIDPTSSRVKLPRMTEALDKMPSVCTTPLSSRKSRDSCSSTDMKIFPETQELKVVLETTLPKLEDTFMKSPETPGSEGRGRGGRGRGSRGGRGRGAAKTPRGRGRGRGGGRGAMYMKETMGIYGRVCGPATTTVQLFEEETCMMDDNATPAKPSHLLDEDSQSSVKSSTNESSNKMRKSKFADLFDSNKVWTAADVKEYMWPPPENPSAEHQVMMIQEQVAMFLGVKSFKRRYPELKRRTVGGEERDYILRKGIVTEALCDLGITAVDASEVLDIMLSDYPHKYEEYRSHQRERQIAVAQEPPEKPEVRVDRVEMKISDKSSDKPEPPKIDPEKTRQDMAAAAIASASEWNARLNSVRRGACADLQTMTVQRRRAPMKSPGTHVKPPAGFYPHALLPGQYQHTYRYYTPDQLRYFPLNTVVAAPPAPPSPCESSSESEPDWGSNLDSSDDNSRHQPPKRKKLMKVKRSSSVVEPKEEPRDEELCRACHLREEGNRKYSHERFLVCANCNCRLHPHCVELPADTIRKVREYAWQCAECKTCCACSLPADDDKMLFCDLCDRGFHIYCVGLDRVPTGRWHCVECAICKSCGARDPHGLAPAAPAPAADWHHQTRRGPGGHKLYSHSLCTPCARAYRIGRYCPLCERSFIGPKGTMQLVICKLCDRQLHQDCVRQTVAALNVLDYTCGDCRRAGISSRSAAARLAPRTIATLFMAKRRFNKYAHRQYLASRAREAGGDAEAEAAPDLSSDPDDPLDGAEPQPFED